MSDVDDLPNRLQRARRLAGFETATDAARVHEWNENTYRSHENGERGLKTGVAQRYAQAFNVSVSWLLTGEGSAKSDKFMPLSGHVIERGNVLLYASNDPKLEINLPIAIPVDSICLRVATNAFMPRYRSGDLLIVRDGKATFGKSPYWYTEPVEGVVWLKDGAIKLGTYISWNKESTVEIYGSAPLRGVQVEEFRPVELVIRRGLYSGTALLTDDKDS